MWGNVAIHQDPAEGKSKGQDASGEAIYLDNPAKNKTITLVYQRDPYETKPRPGPLPPARVENDEKTVLATGGAGVIKINQAIDQARVEGPGVLMQLATRTSASPTAPPDPNASPKITDAPSSRTTTGARPIEEPRATSLLMQNGVPRASAKPASQISQRSTAETEPALIPLTRQPTQSQRRVVDVR